MLTREVLASMKILVTASENNGGNGDGDENQLSDNRDSQ